MMYLDSAATTPVRRDVLEAMWPYLTGDFGNASSRHRIGEAAAAALAEARREVATVLGCRPGEIIFTSGGTEADNLAVKGIALAAATGDGDGPGPTAGPTAGAGSGVRRDSHLVTSSIEHPAVLESCDYLVRRHGFRHTRLGVDSNGLIDLEELDRALGRGAALCSVMYANNEVGTVQRIADIASIADKYSVSLHTDAVQAAGWLPLNVKELGVAALSLSGHKLGAPKGCGVLYLRGRIRAEPLIHGGGQERGRRSGTENVAGAVGMAVALRIAEAQRQQAAERMTAMRNDFAATILAGVDGAILTGHPTERLPSIASFCFPGTSGESVLLELERLDIVCSSGSACAAGSDEPSPVLTALGLEPDVAQTAVRFSLTSDITAEQLGQAAAAVIDAVATVRRLGVP